LVVFITGSFYLDPFNFKNSNFTLNTSDEEIKSFAQNIVETCVALKGQDKPDCYRDELRSFTKEYGFVTGEKNAVLYSRTGCRHEDMSRTLSLHSKRSICERA
jgi:hypothetical protein